MAEEKKSKHKKFLDDYLGIDKSKLDYENLSAAKPDDVIKAYETLHSKKAIESEMGLEAHMMTELHNTVKEFFGENVNFQHIDDENKRRQEATKFANELMRFSIERYYVNAGIKPAEAKKTADVVMSHTAMMDEWGRRLWGEKFRGREGFIRTIMDSDANLRDFLHPDMTGIYKDIYRPVVSETSPHAPKRERLSEELGKRDRYSAVDKYVLSQIKKAEGEEVAGKFKIYAAADRAALMQFAHGLKEGQTLSKEYVKPFYKMFESVHEKYKKAKKK